VIDARSWEHLCQEEHVSKMHTFMMYEAARKWKINPGATLGTGRAY
jgi:hypothetical protein